MQPYTIKEMLHLGLTDGTIRVRSDCPAHPGQVGTVCDVYDAAPLFRVRFPDGEKELYLDREVDVLECHPAVKFLLDVLDPRFWLALSA